MLDAMDVRYAWEYEDTERPRPVEIARLEAFCNTIDAHTYGAHATKVDERRDLLSSPQRLAAWLADAGLLDCGPNSRDTDGSDAGPADGGAQRHLTADDLTADDGDLDDARALRDGLRAWLRARQGLQHDASALDHARQILAGLRMRIGLAEDGVDLDGTSAGITGALERLAADLATADATGTLQRLKICSAPDCGFVYYDHSRSRTSRWCSMDTCGNRAKTRRYRQRR